MTAFKTTSAIAILSVAMALVPLAAEADHHRGYEGHHERYRVDHRWHGDIRVFHDHDYARWRGGYWHHGYHEGRLGWWWVVGGLWYFYPRVVYPYPDPYTPPVVVVQPTAPVTPAPNAPPPPQYWYYCNSAKTYYPYVASCPEGWKEVPATPPTGTSK